jgi:ribonuclease HII
VAGEQRPAARRVKRRWCSIERDLRAAGTTLIAGVDEVGRGPLAGPVVACAVIMPPDTRAIAGVDDSKRLTPGDRVRLAARIRERAVALAVGAASVREIDRVNIYHASVLAMRRAIGRLPVSPQHLLVDGRPIRTLGVPHQAVVHGDARCYAIACASIVAKVTRDRLMEALGRRHPAYRWERNAGYATRDHISGLAEAGLTPHHRRSFCRIEQLTLDLEASEMEGLAHELADAGFPGDASLVPGYADRFRASDEEGDRGDESLDDEMHGDESLDDESLDDESLDEDGLEGELHEGPLVEELASGELLEAPTPDPATLIEHVLDDAIGHPDRQAAPPA